MHLITNLMHGHTIGSLAAIFNHKHIFLTMVFRLLVIFSLVDDDMCSNDTSYGCFTLLLTYMTCWATVHNNDNVKL